MEKNELKKYKNIIKQGLSIREASLILKIAPATIFRRLKKLKQTGDIIHGNTGKQNRKPREDKEEIINLAETKYREFSISHICEMLEIREKININKETLRLWLKRPRKYRKPKQRQRRECSPNFGDLLQIDGSFDYWFGDKKTCLMHIVDDATNTAELYFDKQETIVSACKCAWKWFQKYGIPKAFYADGRNMYHLNPDCEHNFFTAMCEHLGIRVILARSPQAKGRVERWNEIQQQRLIPLLKLDGVCYMQDANKYLENYIVEHNKKFSKSPKTGNSHSPLPDYIKSIDDVCFIETERHLNNDWTFSYEGKIYQIPRLSKYPPAKSKIKLKITISGKIFVFYRYYSFSLF